VSSVTIKVAPEVEGTRLDSFLSTVPDVGSRTRAQRLIAEGMVLVDGETRGKNHRLRAGEVIDATLPPPRETGLEPEEMDLDIPYEDRWLLVVDKPAGMVTHPAKGHDSGTLVHGLLAHGAAGGEHPRRPGIVHRLDKDTSGLLVVARDAETHRLLVDLLSRHEVRRTYIALVHGSFQTAEGTIDAPVGRDRADRQKMSVGGDAGRDAVTHFRVLESWKDAGRAHGGDDGYSLLEVELETGRTHQIRVHLAAIGHPVAGDTTYGRRHDALGIGRQFLHAARLGFRHPHTGETVEVESPLPDDLSTVLQHLRGRS